MVVSSGAEGAIRALERAYDEAWTAGDLVRVLSCFSSDPVIITPEGRLLRGLSEVRAGLQAVMVQPARAQHVSTVDAVHLVTAEVAVVDGRAVVAAHAPTGVTDEALVHSFTDILVRQDGRWRIAHVRAYRFLG